MSNWMKEIGTKGGCHTGNPVVFEAMGVSVHGGGHSRNGGWHRMSPAPDLAMGPSQVMDRVQGTEVPNVFNCANLVGGSTHIISMDFPDFDIPQDVGREWWLALVDDIQRLGIKTVSTQCVGGHGRTGVQLSILAHIMGATSQPDACSLIKWVRQAYCSHAVETFAQQEYVAECCDIPVGDSLFPLSKKSSVSIDFADEGDYISKPKSIYWDDDPLEEEDSLSIPKKFNLLGCFECGTTEWTHEDNRDSPCRCGNPERVNAEDSLYECQSVCYGCDNMVNAMTIQDDGLCIECHAHNNDIKIRKGDIQCKGCKRYYIPETINGKTFKCVACEYKATQKPKKKKNGKKTKNPPVPKGGLKGKNLLDFIDDFKEENC